MGTPEQHRYPERCLDQSQPVRGRYPEQPPTLPPPTHTLLVPLHLTTSLSPTPFLLSYKLQPGAPGSLLSDVKLAARPLRSRQEPGTRCPFLFSLCRSPTSGAPSANQTRMMGLCTLIPDLRFPRSQRPPQVGKVMGK